MANKDILKDALRTVHNMPNHEQARNILSLAIKSYLEQQDEGDARKGTTTSPKKAAASAANGKKGGRPKGSKNKPKPSS